MTVITIQSKARETIVSAYDLFPPFTEAKLASTPVSVFTIGNQNLGARQQKTINAGILDIKNSEKDIARRTNTISVIIKIKSANSTPPKTTLSILAEKPNLFFIEKFFFVSISRFVSFSFGLLIIYILIFNINL